MTDRFLDGRAAWVTDAGSEPGRSIAIALASAGAWVACGLAAAPAQDGAAPRPTVKLGGLEGALGRHGAAAFVDGLDLRDNPAVDRFHSSAVDRLGPIDILVNSAAVTDREFVSGHRKPVWDAVLDVNLNGAYRTTKRCLPAMIDRRYGRIVNIASTAARTGRPMQAAYCASMAAILGLTRSVALEGAEHGVTCNAICPGWIDEDPAGVAERAGSPDQISKLVVFLCSKEALGITTEALSVTGGAAPTVDPDAPVW